MLSVNNVTKKYGKVIANENILPMDRLQYFSDRMVPESPQLSKVLSVFSNTREVLRSMDFSTSQSRQNVLWVIFLRFRHCTQTLR